MISSTVDECTESINPKLFGLCKLAKELIPFYKEENSNGLILFYNDYFNKLLSEENNYHILQIKSLAYDDLIYAGGIADCVYICNAKSLHHFYSVPCLNGPIAKYVSKVLASYH